jgi:hypothetical protein
VLALHNRLKMIETADSETEFVASQLKRTADQFKEFSPPGRLSGCQQPGQLSSAENQEPDVVLVSTSGHDSGQNITAGIVNESLFKTASSVSAALAGPLAARENTAAVPSSKRRGFSSLMSHTSNPALKRGKFA